MRMLSEDDLDLAGMSDEELNAAWDLWFDLAQSTNEHDPLWTHGVFVGLDGPERVGQAASIERKGAAVSEPPPGSHRRP